MEVKAAVGTIQVVSTKKEKKHFSVYAPLIDTQDWLPKTNQERDALNGQKINPEQ